MIPALGFGTWRLNGRDCEEGVADALAAGYRHVDTAAMYGNEEQVARGLAAAGVERGLTREIGVSNFPPDLFREALDLALTPEDRARIDALAR